VVSPIIHWQADDIWRFIVDMGLPYCKLYDQGYTRTGCILCPMAARNARLRDLERYPTICERIRLAAKARWEERKATGAPFKSYTAFADFTQFWNWWLADGPIPGKPERCQGQLEFWS